MKKLKLFISLWFTMFSVAVFAQAEFEKIAITQNTQDNLAGRLLVQDVTTGEIRYILKSVLDNKFNQPTGNATQYLDGAGNPTTFPVLGQSDRVITEVRNTTGATVTKGTVVYLTGASGGKPTIQKAQANAESTSSGTFGVIQSDINNNSNGYVVVIGTVLGLNTSSYSEGQILWLSPTTAGGFTTTKPVAPNHAVYVAIVTLASTQGTIEVKIQNGYEIDELHDVLIVSKTDNDGLIYDAASGLWKNKQITKSMVGLGNVDNTSDVNKPISTATQNALNLKENKSEKNVANGYAGLGSDGKLFSNQLPSITITDTFVIGSQAAMLALTAETGDVAVRTDVNKSYILKGTDPAVLAGWQELLTPTSAVTSVFGRNGAVTAQNGDYTTALVTETTNKRYQTDIQQAYNDATSSIQSQLNAKEPSISAPGTTGSYWRGNKTFATLDTSVIPENGSLFFTNDRARAAISLTTTGTSGAATYSSSTGVLNIPNYATGIGGSGTTNYVPKFTAASTLGNSLIFDNGSSVRLGTTLGAGDELLMVSMNGTTNTQAINVKDQNVAANASTFMVFRKSDDTFLGNIRRNGTENSLYIGGNENLILGTGGNTERLRLNSSGQLEVKGGSTAANAQALITNSDTDFNFYASNTSGVNKNINFLYNGGSGQAMRIAANGNVAIGTTTTANGNLTVKGGATSFELATDASQVQMLSFDRAAGAYKNFSFRGLDFIFSPTDVERVRIYSNGNIAKLTTTGFDGTFDNLIKYGTASDLNSGNSNANRWIGIDATVTAGAAVTNALRIRAYGGGTGNAAPVNVADFRGDQSAVFYGSVTATGFFQSSDLRLKDIISRDGDVIKYKWKDKRDAKLHIGYVAQEVQKENPEQVNTDDKGMLSVNYIEILVEKIRKLEKEIELLKAK